MGCGWEQRARVETRARVEARDGVGGELETCCPVCKARKNAEGEVHLRPAFVPWTELPGACSVPRGTVHGVRQAAATGDVEPGVSPVHLA